VIVRGTLRAILPIVVVLVGLGACSSGSAPPRRTSTVTVTPTATSISPSASPMPTLPAAAQQPTRPGAEAFARHFFAVYNYAFWNADPAPLQTLSDAECVYCNSVASGVTAMRSKGNRVEGGRILVTTAVAAPGDPQVGLLVNLILDQDAGRTLSASGALVGTTAERRNGRADVAVRWGGTSWVMLDVHLLRDGES
jgi:hypothetical protein